MAWYSILPDHLTSIETLLIRLFLLLAIINISPWILAILYDLGLYLARYIWYEIPFIGGRAQGQARPRATSLRETAMRRTSFAEMIGGGSPARNHNEQHREELRRRHQQKSEKDKKHARTFSDESIPEEEEEERAEQRT